MSNLSSIVRKVTLTTESSREIVEPRILSFGGGFYIDRFEWYVVLSTRGVDDRKELFLEIRLPETVKKAIRLWVQKEKKREGRVKATILSTDGHDTPVLEKTNLLDCGLFWRFISAETWSTLLDCISTTVTSSGSSPEYKHEIQMLITIDSEDFLTYVRTTQPSTPLTLYPLLTLLEKPLFSDTTLVVANRKFHVHKCILAAQSSVFHAMFESEMLESIEGTVNITDITPTTMDALLKCVYGQEAAAVCSDPRDATDLLIAADKYRFENLLWSAEQLLLRLPTNRESSETAFRLFNVGYRLNRPAIMKLAVQIIIRDNNRLMGSISLENLKDLEMVKQMLVLLAQAAAESSKVASQSNP